MIKIPEEIKDVFKKDNIRKNRRNIKLSFFEEKIYLENPFFNSGSINPWFVIENKNIVSESLKIIDGISESDEMVYGSCVSAEVQISVFDINFDLTGKEFVLSIELSGEEISLGIFKVQSFKRESNSKLKKIIAYDRMNEFDINVADWYNSQHFPMTVKTFRDSLCRKIGIEQEKNTLIFDSMEIQKTMNPSKLLAKELLFCICEINGCFGKTGRDGRLQYKKLQKTGLYPSESLFPEEELHPSELGGDGMDFETVLTYKNPIIYEDYMVDGINGISIYDEDGNQLANVGKTDCQYKIYGNFLLYEKSSYDALNIADSLLKEIGGETYRPAKIDCSFFPWIESGDAIRIVTGNDIIETYVMKRTISGCQNMRDKIESYGTKNREKRKSIKKDIISTNGNMVRIEKTAKNVSTVISNFEKETVGKLEVTSGKISAEVSRAQKEEGELSGLISQNESSILLKVSKGDISAEISQESEDIYFRGNRFEWQSENSLMTPDGTIECNGINAKNGEFSGNVKGTNVSGGEINASKINGNTVKSSVIKASTISGSNIVLESLIASPQLTTDDELIAGENVSVNIQNITTSQVLCSGIEPSQIDLVFCSKQYIGPYPKQDSDFRLKTELKKFKNEETITAIKKINPCLFDFKKSKKKGIGFIAQDVEKMLKDIPFKHAMYSIGDDGIYTIPYDNYIGILTKNIIDIKDRIENIKTKGEET